MKLHDFCILIIQKQHLCFLQFCRFFFQLTHEVFAELILGQPLFTGKDGVDQLVGA